MKGTLRYATCGVESLPRKHREPYSVWTNQTDQTVCWEKEEDTGEGEKNARWQDLFSCGDNLECCSKKRLGFVDRSEFFALGNGNLTAYFLHSCDMIAKHGQTFMLESVTSHYSSLLHKKRIILPRTCKIHFNCGPPSTCQLAYSYCLYLIVTAVSPHILEVYTTMWNKLIYWKSNHINNLILNVFISKI